MSLTQKTIGVQHLDNVNTLKSVSRQNPICSMSNKNIINENTNTPCSQIIIIVQFFLVHLIC